MNDVKNGSGDLKCACINWVSPLWLVNSKLPARSDFLGNKRIKITQCTLYAYLHVFNIPCQKHLTI